MCKELAKKHNQPEDENNTEGNGDPDNNQQEIKTINKTKHTVKKYPPQQILLNNINE